MSACPDCRYFGAAVVETRRLQNGWVRRIRTCSCGHKWKTFEIPQNELELKSTENLKEVNPAKKESEA